MSMYQPNIPTGTVNLNEDYLNIQKNFTQLNTTYGVDHLAFNNQSPQNGYHSVIRLNPSATPTTPVKIDGIGQVFDAVISDGFNTDTSFYLLSGLGNLIQMTRNFVPSASANGYTFIPGGLVVQWGSIPKPGATWPQNTPQSYVFTGNSQKAYPSNNFIVLAMMYGPNTQGSQGSASITVKSTTGFSWLFSGNPNSTFTNVLWVSIGN